MGTDMHEQINVGQIGVRFLLEVKSREARLRCSSSTCLQVHGC